MADSYRDNAEPLYDQAPGAYMHVEPDEVVPTNFDNPLYFQGKSGQATQDTGYLAVQPDWLSEQWDLLAEQPWFRGFMQREDAMSELGPKSPGSFVVRVSNSEPGHYAISATQHNSMDHMLILPSYAGTDSSAPGNTRYRLGTYSKLLFNTVPKLIAYYIDHEYIDVRRLQGEVHAENQVGGYMDVNPHAPSTWNKGHMGREEAEALLGGRQLGAFVARTKQGTGYVISQVVPEPKGFVHHLVTVKQGEWFVDNVAVGAFRNLDGLVDVGMQDTLGVLHCPLVDVFSQPGGGSYRDQYGGGEALYDSAGNNPEAASANAALYDTAANNMEQQMGDMAIYDQANTGYLGVEPAPDGEVNTGYLGVEPAPAGTTGYLGVEPYEGEGASTTGYLGVEPAQFDGTEDPYAEGENPYGDNGEPFDPYGRVGDPDIDYQPQNNDVEL